MVSCLDQACAQTTSTFPPSPQLWTEAHWSDRFRASADVSEKLKRFVPALSPQLASTAGRHGRTGNQQCVVVISNSGVQC